MPTYKVSEMKGVVRDVGFGKLPDGTFNTLTNFDTNYEQGSLVSRSGYTSAISAPSGMTNALRVLNAPVIHPTATDMFLSFDIDPTNGNTFLYPYWHNSSTATSGWVDVQDYISTTFTASGSTVDIAASATSNQYKNWVFIQEGSLTTKYFIQSNDAAGVCTLNRAAPTSGSSNCILIRYFHDQSISSYGSHYFNTYSTPTNPACYSSDLAIRWSAGQSSNIYHKNRWAGYLSKNFFYSSGASAYQFTGTYITEAECKAPTIADLGTPVLSAVQIGTNGILNSSDRSYEGVATNNWAAAGSASLAISNLTLDVNTDNPKNKFIEPKQFTVLNVNYTAAGSSNYIRLTTASNILLSSGSSYIFKINYHNSSADTIKLSCLFSTVVPSSDQTINVVLNPSGASESLNSTDVTFTASGSWNRVDIFVDTISSIQIGSVDIFLTSSVTVDAVKTSTTYTLYGSYVYDGFQESELVKLDDIYHTISQATLAYTLKLDFAPLNKRITAVRTYIDITDGDQTLSTDRNFTKYLLKDISIADNDASWVLTSNLYQRTFTIAGADIKTALSNYTWEQKTNRIASTSTTCSYDIAKYSSGRIFLAREYDYAEAKEYTQRVRYTGFNGDGIMCPDIFPNITDRNITYVTAGSGVKVNALAEYDGNLIVVKEGSIVELTTGDIVELWRMRVINNNFASLGKNSVLKSEKGMIFGGVDDMIIWRGGDTQSIVEGVWKNLYQTEVDSANPDGFFIIQKKHNGNIEVFPDTISSGENTSYEFNVRDFIPKINTYPNQFIFITALKDNTIYGMISTGAIYKFDKSYTQDLSSNITPSFITNKLLPDSKHNVVVSEVFLTLEGAGVVDGSSVLTLKGDGASLQTYTISDSGLDNTIKFYRFKVKPHKPARYLQIEFGAGLYSTSVNGLKIHEFGFEFEVQKDFGDVTYT